MKWNKETDVKINVTFTEAEARWLREVIRYPFDTDMGRLAPKDPEETYRKKLFAILEAATK